MAESTWTKSQNSGQVKAARLYLGQRANFRLNQVDGYEACTG